MDRLVAFLVLCIAAATTALAGDKKKDPNEIGNRDVGKGVNFYSIEREIALGKALDQQMQQQAKMVEDPLITEYVNRLGQNLARNSDAKVPFTFRVIDADDLNAFAFPGGFVYVHTGLLRVAETEAELAGAMAHEIAHVAARHITKQMTRSQLAQILSLPARVLIGGWAGYGIGQGAGVASTVGFLKMDRGFETEADFLGMQYMYAAGYDPTASIDLFERMISLEKTRPGTMAKVFSTHPPNEARLKKTQEEIDKILPSKPEYIVNTSEYNDIRARLFAFENRRKAADRDPNQPRLRNRPGSGTIPADEKDDKDDRPTLKRRDLVE